VAVAYSRMKKHNHHQARLNAIISASERALPRPTETAYTTLRQIVQWIPEELADRLAREAGADIRTFTAFSHVLALLYRDLLQGTQADASAPGLCRVQPEGGKMAGLDGAAHPPAASFSEARIELETQLFTARRYRPLGGVDEGRPARNPTTLWDSRWSQAACNC